MAFTVEFSHDIDAFAPDWPSLAHPGASAHYFFQTSDALKIWQRTIGVARRMLPCYVRVASPADRTLLLLALGIEERHGVKVLVALDGGVSDYNAPIIFDGGEAVAGADLWSRLRATLPGFDAAILEKLPVQILSARNPLVVEGAPAVNCGYEIDLKPDWKTYAATRLHRAKDSRRKRRRLAELGAVRFVVAGGEAERERLFAAFIRQKTRRYLEKNGADGFARPGYRTYFAQMTEQLHPRGHVHLSALEIGGQIVATHWGVIANKRFYCLMLAYEDCAAARYSPAHLLVEELIQWSFAAGLQTFDLGFGHADWKLKFGACRSPLTLRQEASTALGWAYLNARRLRARLGQAQHKAGTRVPLRGEAMAAPVEAA